MALMLSDIGAHKAPARILFLSSVSGQLYMGWLSSFIFVAVFLRQMQFKRSTMRTVRNPLIAI